MGKEKKLIERPCIDVIVDEDWDNVKGKSKGKSKNMQRNNFSTTHDITWQDKSGTREGPQKAHWQ